jgi:hypothetical protein
MSAIGRPRSLPRVSGTMQNEQRMLQPCMMETKAVAVGPSGCGRGWCFASLLPRRRRRRFALQRPLGVVHAGFEAALEDGVHVFEHLVVFLRADDDIEVRHG